MWRRFDLYSASQPFSLVSRIPDQKTPPALLTRIVTGPELGGGLRQRGVHRGAVPDVDGNTERTDLLGGGRTRVGVAFPDRDPCAERRQPCRDAAADACAAAGDDRDAVGQENA